MRDKPFTILGIETSCDETAASVVRGRIPGPGEILSNIVFSQTEAHAPYGGVVPEIASRAHLEILDGVIERALDEAKITLQELDGIAATAGPGLIGGVMVGLTTAKALALCAGKPLLAVNHLMGHALTARLTHGVEFPFLLLLVSGGHCQLLGVGGVDDFRLYGSTIDDAVGEAFDKTAKILGLPYPGGPAVEEAARSGNPKAYDLPRPLLFKNKQDRAGADFSFSGLKTALRQRLFPGRCDRYPARPQPLRHGPVSGRFPGRQYDGGRGRRGGQSGDRRGAGPIVRKRGFHPPRPAAQTLYRQCGHDRLGGRGTSCGRRER